MEQTSIKQMTMNNTNAQNHNRSNSSNSSSSSSSNKCVRFDTSHLVTKISYEKISKTQHHQIWYNARELQCLLAKERKLYRKNSLDGYENVIDQQDNSDNEVPEEEEACCLRGLEKDFGCLSAIQSRRHAKQYREFVINLYDDQWLNYDEVNVEVLRQAAQLKSQPDKLKAQEIAKQDEAFVQWMIQEEDKDNDNDNNNNDNNDNDNNNQNDDQVVNDNDQVVVVNVDDVVDVDNVDVTVVKKEGMDYSNSSLGTSNTESSTTISTSTNNNNNETTKKISKRKTIQRNFSGGLKKFGRRAISSSSSSKSKSLPRRTNSLKMSKQYGHC